MASLPAESTQLVVPRELELFQTEPLDMSVMDMEEIPHRPISTYLPSAGDIKFEIKGSTEEYMKPSYTYMTFGLQIVNADGSEMDNTAMVGPVNNFAHSVFQTVQVIMGNQVVVSETNYPYRAYITNTLSYGNDAKESHLTLSIYRKDVAGEMDTALRAGDLPAQLEHLNGGNAALNYRAIPFRLSRIVPCRIHLDCDLFNVDKFIPNQVDMTVILTRTQPRFCLMGSSVANRPPNYKVNIIDPVLWVTKAKIFPTIALMHGEKFAREPAEYNIVRTVTRPITITRGVNSATLDNVTTGQLPRRVFYGFVKNSAYSGSYAENPFNFEHITLTQTALYVDGKCHPITPFQPLYTGENKNYVREYWSLFSALGIRHGNAGIGINRDEYPNGYCLYGFDISPNRAGYKSTPLNLKNKGTIRIEFQCSTALPGAYLCIVFAEYDNILSVDADRNVYVNYTV
jgi:hypothetical protein